MSFDQQDRKTLARCADILIPAGAGMPSASQAGVADQWLDAVLSVRPDLAEALATLLAEARDRDPREVVTDWQNGDPTKFGVLAEVVAGAYFMNPAVQRAVGYSGQAPRPIDPYPDYMDDGLLASVIRRGPIYRPTPGRPQV